MRHRKRTNTFDSFLQDIRFGLRMLWRTPLPTLAALITLALGIGANATIFTLLDDLLLRPLPVREPGRLVQVVLRGDSLINTFSFPAVTAARERVHTVTGLFTWNATDFSLGWGVDARHLKGAVAGGAAYQTLGIKAEAGRLFDSDDDARTAPAVAVISDRFWESEFQRDRQAIGRKITLDRHPFKIVGVTPRSFYGISPGMAPDVTIPFHANAALHPKWDMEHTTRMWWLSLLGRLQQGVPMAQAEAEMGVISPGLLKSIDPTGSEFVRSRLGLIPAGRGISFLAQRYAKPFSILIAVSGLVLLITCVNLANLILARAAQREKELSVRLAWGARRGRLIRQLLTESLVLSCVGAALGGWVTSLGMRLAAKLLPLTFDPQPDWRVLCYLAALALLTGVLFGIWPAICGTDLKAHEALKLGRIGLGTDGWRSGRSLVALQVALSVVLLSGALLFVRSLRNLESQNIGFERENLVFVAIDSQRSGLNAQQLGQFYSGLLERVRALPFVQAASLAVVVPLSGGAIYDEVDHGRWPNLSAAQRTIYQNRVASEYFKTAGIPFLAGRDFDDRDSGTEKVTILTAAAARMYFPGRNAMGQLLMLKPREIYRVIGIVGDSKYVSLRDPAPRTMFLPVMQAEKMGANPMMAGTTWNLLVRASSDAGAVTSAVREYLRASGKDMAADEAVPYEALINSSLLTERVVAGLASFFGILAAMLAGLGVYGVLGFAVSRRTSEIGVRLALGATTSELRWMVLLEALIPAGLGAAVGLLAAAGSGRFVTSFLFEVRPSDPLVLLVAATVMMVFAAVAGYLPARRASLLDPMVALRSE